VSAAATVAAIELMRMSRFLMWASSCAMTPSSSSWFISSSKPAVTATDELLGLRPVAKAFGACSGITQSFGIGSSMRWHRFRVMGSRRR
jgi:hypothetical protein